LAKGAEVLGPGSLNALYSQLLSAFRKGRIRKRMTADDRSHLHNALGLCLAQSGKLDEALREFAAQRQLLETTKNEARLSESYLNSGYALYNAGREGEAAADYRKAIAHARKCTNHRLLGRALHDLAMTIVAHAPDDAEKLLRESAREKRKAKDDDGQVGILFGRGLLRLYRGDIAGSVRWFKRAETRARQRGDVHGRCLVLYNLGCACTDLGDERKSLRYFQKVRALAEKAGFDDSLARALGGEAIARGNLGHYRQAEKLFRELHELHIERGNFEDGVIALHDAGYMLLHRRLWSAARKTIRLALGHARKHDIQEWVFRCARDLALVHDAQGAPRRTLQTLRKLAVAEKSAGRFDVAARLWGTVVEVCIRDRHRPAMSEEAFAKAVSCLPKKGRATERLQVLTRLFDWRWVRHDSKGALRALRQIEAEAVESGQVEQRARAVDQQGMCLQELGRITEAIPYHRAALKIARRFSSPELTGNCLNNLGEALRRTNQSKAALRALTEAVSVARAAGDEESAISTSHNRALVLEDLSRFREAARVLRWCRDAAKQRGFWEEYVRSLHGQANLAWRLNQPKKAEQLYRKALSQARGRGTIRHVFPISLNLANLFRWKGQPERAVDILRAAESGFLELPDAHEYLTELAAAASESGEASTARDSWLRAKEHAERVGDKDTVAMASAALAETLEAAGRFSQANEQLQSALIHEENPERQMSILLDLLRVLLRLGKAHQAGRAFSRLRQMAAAHSLPGYSVDAHVMLAAHYRDRHEYLQAAKAYTAALIPAFNVDFDTMVQVGAQCVNMLISLQPAERKRRIDTVERHLRNWAQKELSPRTEARNIDIVLWPCRVACHIVTAEETGKELSETQVGRIIMQEIRQSVEK